MDLSTILAAAIGAAPATIFGILAYRQSRRNGIDNEAAAKTLVEVKLHLNSRLTELLNVTRSSAHAAGVTEEKGRIPSDPHSPTGAAGATGPTGPTGP